MATPIPENHATFSLAEVTRLTQARFTGDPASTVTGVTTDSRGALDGRLFVALRGERFDGHRFVQAALGQGARAAIVQQEIPGVDDRRLIRVDDTLRALGELSLGFRRRWGKCVIAVAGSAGKTTTRAAISALLKGVAKARVHAVRGNLNNRVGLPMVLLGLTDEHDYCVVELGTNQRGEVRELSAIAEPDVGVLTLIDIEHTLGLGGLDDIEQEEGDLLACLKPGNTAIYNADDPRVRRQLSRSLASRRVGYGLDEGAQVRLLRRHPTGLAGARLSIEEQLGEVPRNLDLHCPLLGEAGALSYTAAVAVVRSLFPADALDFSHGPSSLIDLGLGEPGRLCPIELKDHTVLLDDTYNASPASMLSSARTSSEIAQARAARLGMVLGEMRELGAVSVSEHRRVGDALRSTHPAWLVAVAGDAKYLAEAAGSVSIPNSFVEDAEAALRRVEAELSAGDVVLVKASRAVGLERVVQALTQRVGV